MIANKKLSKNFTLHEMLTSQTAVRHGYIEQFAPNNGVVDSLEQLCGTILQPLRDGIRCSLHVSSGYRCLRVNTAIGGSRTSQHLVGQAADIQDFKHGNEYLLRKIVDLALPFDQLINEFNYQWVHVSFSPTNPRRQILEAYKDADQKTKYRPIVI